MLQLHCTVSLQEHKVILDIAVVGYVEVVVIVAVVVVDIVLVGYVEVVVIVAVVVLVVIVAVAVAVVVVLDVVVLFFVVLVVVFAAVVVDVFDDLAHDLSVMAVVFFGAVENDAHVEYVGQMLLAALLGWFAVLCGSLAPHQFHRTFSW